MLDQKDKEIQAIKDKLEASRQQGVPEEPASQEQIHQLEAETAELRKQSNHEVPQFRSFSPTFGDDEGFQIYEDESASDENRPADEDDDATVRLELEDALQAKQTMLRSSQSFSSSFVHFEDSPARSSTSNRNTPAAPEVSVEVRTKELNAAINRAEEAEVALQAMNLEIKSLGFPYEDSTDASECLAAIKSHFRDMRFELERIAPGESTISFDNSKLMPEMLSKLKAIATQTRDRDAELRSMREQQRSLKGNFDHALVAADKANAKIRELEDILDKNAEEMLEQRMRAQALERESKEQQHNARALIAALEKYRHDNKRLEELVELVEAEQAARLQEVRTATIAEFNQQFSDMDAKVDAETRGRRAAEESAVERLRRINELESVISSARQDADDVKDQLKLLEKQLASSKRANQEEVQSLQLDVSRQSTDLEAANAKIDKLNKKVASLETRYYAAVEHLDEYAANQHNQMLRAAAQSAEAAKKARRSAKVSRANWELESEMDDLPSDPVLAPMTPSSIVRFSEFSEIEDSDDRNTRENSVVDGDEDGGDDDHVPGRVELSRGKKHRRSRSSSIGVPASSPLAGMRVGILKKPRRRYDSGIGMDSLSEAEDEREPELPTSAAMLEDMEF